MSEYVPTTDEVIECVCGEGAIGYERAEFDRWLASVKADVWDESMHAMAEAWGWPPERHSGPNPYRESGSGT